MKNILITGDMGYIGTNLTQYLIEKKMNVYGMDKLRGEKQRIENFGIMPGAYDGIIHLAAVSSVLDCETDIVEAVCTNINGSINIFNEAAEEGIPVVFASSQAAKHPVNVYGMTKFIAGRHAIKLNNQGANIKILRFANVYGGIDFLEKKSVIATFLRNIRDDRELIINGDGTQIRDFIFIEDICRAIYLALMEPKVINKPIDIGTGKGTKIIDLAKMISNKFTFNKKYDILEIKENVVDPKDGIVALQFKAEYELNKLINKEMEGLKDVR